MLPYGPHPAARGSPRMLSWRHEKLCIWFESDRLNFDHQLNLSGNAGFFIRPKYFSKVLKPSHELTHGRTSSTRTCRFWRVATIAPRISQPRSDASFTRYFGARSGNHPSPTGRRYRQDFPRERQFELSPPFITSCSIACLLPYRLASTLGTFFPGPKRCQKVPNT